MIILLNDSISRGPKDKPDRVQLEKCITWEPQIPKNQRSTKQWGWQRHLTYDRQPVLGDELFFIRLPRCNWLGYFFAQSRFVNLGRHVLGGGGERLERSELGMECWYSISVGLYDCWTGLVALGLLPPLFFFLVSSKNLISRNNDTMSIWSKGSHSVTRG